MPFFGSFVFLFKACIAAFLKRYQQIPFWCSNLNQLVQQIQVMLLRKPRLSQKPWRCWVPVHIPNTCDEYYKYQQNINKLQNEHIWIQWILSAPVLFVLGLMHRSRRHPWNCQASTGLLAKDVVWVPSPASAKKTQSWHRQGGQNPVECAEQISMFGENGELPDVSSRKLSFLLPIHRQWRRPKKSWQILGQQVESQLVCHCSSLALVNPIHSAAMPPPVVCVGGGDQECGRSIFSPINDDEKMYFILLEEAIWLCFIVSAARPRWLLEPETKKHCNFHEISKQTSHFDEWCPMKTCVLHRCCMASGRYWLSVRIFWATLTVEWCRQVILDLTAPGEVSQQPFGHHRQGDACKPQSWHKEAHIGQ